MKASVSRGTGAYPLLEEPCEAAGCRRVVPHWLKCSSERVCPTPELQRADTLARAQSEDARYVLRQIEIPPQAGLKEVPFLVSRITERGTCVRALHTHTHTRIKQEQTIGARARTQTMFLIRSCCRPCVFDEKRERKMKETGCEGEFWKEREKAEEREVLC